MVKIFFDKYIKDQAIIQVLKRKLLWLYALGFSYTAITIVLATSGKLCHLCQPTETFPSSGKQPDSAGGGVIRMLILSAALLIVLPHCI